MKTVTVTAHLHASRWEVFSQVVDARKRFLTDNPVTEMQIVSGRQPGSVRCIAGSSRFPSA